MQGNYPSSAFVLQHPCGGVLSPARTLQEAESSLFLSENFLSSFYFLLSYSSPAGTYSHYQDRDLIQP